MKIKTIDHLYDEAYEGFDKRVNDFIKDKQVIQITTNDVIGDDGFHAHTLTILYEEVEDDD
ncbi:hypothetical protein [Pediococcus pentosaceus]|uniref:hypothetical protein n=1 Tax=Pediococcus pentosaceus TaxID=1255 RepID=UPI00223B3483|nr:hypothetical protein [Pediococcus pentosaceus]MCT1176767.1 hypothetical protein [Pediococcus pentosaceus]